MITDRVLFPPNMLPHLENVALCLELEEHRTKGPENTLISSSQVTHKHDIEPHSLISWQSPLSIPLSKLFAHFIGVKGS